MRLFVANVTATARDSGVAITVELLPACEGDALWVRHTAHGESFNMLVDGGRLATGRRLVERIRSSSTLPFRLDLLVVTHVDRDHIEGVIELLTQCDNSELTVAGIWFNGYSHLPAPASRADVLQAQGAVMGNRLEALIRARGIPWNQAFNGGAVVWDEAAFFSVMVAPQLRLTVLGPTYAALEALRPKWEFECQRAGIMPGGSDLQDFLLAPQGAPAPFDFDALHAVPFRDDNAVANGSSIVLLVEDLQCDGRNVLLAGDAFAHALEGALRALRAQRGDLRIDAMKIPHHGSERNLSLDLLEVVACRDYLVSTNGHYFSHPDDISLARIVRRGQRSAQPSTLYFNYPSVRTQAWCTTHRQHQLGYQVRVAQPDESLLWP